MKPLPLGQGSDNGLDYMAVEISYGSRWVDINDQDRFRISGDGTRDSAQKTWRKITAQSPVLGGSYLIHAVPEMINEQVNLWIYGDSQTGVSENLEMALSLFEQIDFRIRWTFNDYREYWRCQLADAVISRNHVWTHNTMAAISFTVPRYPDVTRERI